MAEEGTIIRTIEEITASAKLNMLDMTNKAIALGHDLADAKEVLGHGNFLPWLREIHISSSSAANFMRVAREVPAGSRLAGMQYSKVLALLSAPAEDREALADETEGKSAAEIRRLIAERDKAAESCNAESTRADQAEADAKRFYDENARLNNKVADLEERIEREQRVRDLEDKNHNEIVGNLKDALKRARDDLDAERNKTPEEVLPAGYKEEKEALLNAAEEAEARATAAEEELEKLRSERAEGRVSDYEKLHYQMKVFFLNCELLACNTSGLLPDRDKAIRDIDRIMHWCQVVRDELCKAVIATNPEEAVIE